MILTCLIALRKLSAVVIPCLISQILAEGINAVNILTVSRLGDPELTAGVALALIFVNFSTQSVIYGMNVAI